jgi:hypothetical protein
VVVADLNRRVLVFDARMSAALELRGALSRAGFRPSLALDREEALELLSSLSPRVVLLGEVPAGDDVALRAAAEIAGAQAILAPADPSRAPSLVEEALAPARRSAATPAPRPEGSNAGLVTRMLDDLAVSLADEIADREEQMSFVSEDSAPKIDTRPNLVVPAEARGLRSDGVTQILGMLKDLDDPMLSPRELPVVKAPLRSPRVSQMIVPELAPEPAPRSPDSGGSSSLFDLAVGDGGRERGPVTRLARPNLSESLAANMPPVSGENASEPPRDSTRPGRSSPASEPGVLPSKTPRTEELPPLSHEQQEALFGDSLLKSEIFTPPELRRARFPPAQTPDLTPPYDSRYRQAAVVPPSPAPRESAPPAQDNAPTPKNQAQARRNAASQHALPASLRATQDAPLSGALLPRAVAAPGLSRNTEPRSFDSRSREAVPREVPPQHTRPHEAFSHEARPGEARPVEARTSSLKHTERAASEARPASVASPLGPGEPLVLQNARRLAAEMRARSSGVWRCVSGREERLLSLVQGSLSGLASNAPDDHLATLLHRAGRLTRAQRDEALRLTGTPEQLAAELLRRGVARRAEIEAALSSQREEILAGLLEGSWEKLPQAPHGAALSGSWLPRVLLAALRRRLRASEVRPLFARLSFLRGESPLAAPQDLGLSPEEIAPLLRLQGEVPLAALVDGAAEELALPLLAGLEVLGLVRVAAPSVSPEGEDELSLDRERVEGMYEEIVLSDYFAILGVSRRATAYEIQRAHRALRDAFDPARFQDAGRAALLSQVEQIREVLDDALVILSDDATREAYLAHLVDS